jgi:hypothetical protein
MLSPAEVLLQVARALEDLSIPYVVVGSFASAARGLPRATNDVDFVADIQSAHVPALLAALTNDFYIDEKAVRRAVESRRSFNAIHFDSAFKVDFFIPPATEFSRQQLVRRQLESLTPDAARRVYVATAEDTLLGKLRWFRAGGGVSERQWSDVLGIIKVQGERLDLDYLRGWADRLNVRDLLEQSLGEAGII